MNAANIEMVARTQHISNLTSHNIKLVGDLQATDSVQESQKFGDSKMPHPTPPKVQVLPLARALAMGTWTS